LSIELRTPAAGDRDQYLDLVRHSRALHRPWVYLEDSKDAYKDYLKRIAQPTHEGFFVSESKTGDLIGVVNINEIVRGGFRSGYLGYYVFEPYAGKGLMKRGLTLAIRQAFGSVALHRLEANVQPGNKASIALVKGLGFRSEGISSRYLKIGGRWRDHERWALIAENWKAPKSN